MPQVDRPLPEWFVGVHPAEIPGFEKAGVKCPTERDCTAFHLWESKNIFSSILFFFSPRPKGTVTATVPGDIAPQHPRHLGALSRSPTTRGCSQGWSGQAHEPRSSPNSVAWVSQEAPLGSMRPARCSALGPETQYQILWHRSHPCSFTGTVSEVSQRIFPPSPAPGTAKHFLGLGTHAGEPAGADEGTEQGGCTGRGSYQHLPCCAWQHLGLVHCRHPQSQAGSPWDEVKMHYFHLLAAAKRPQASCLWSLALRQAEQTQPVTSTLGIGAGELLWRS